MRCQNFAFDVVAEFRFLVFLESLKSKRVRVLKHEFESLLFSSSKVYATFYDESVERAIERIIGQYDNPEDINNSPATAPSKRILSLIKYYNKVNDGNLIALEIGIDRIIEQCPRFAKWISMIREILEI